MTVGLSDRLRKVRRTALVATGVAVATFQLSGSLGLRINTSPSLPMGLYITTADASANLVEFCPVEPFATLSTTLLSVGCGMCWSFLNIPAANSWLNVHSGPR